MIFPTDSGTSADWRAENTVSQKANMNPKNLWPSLNLRGNPSAKQTASVWNAVRKRRKVFPQIQEHPQIEGEKIGSEETNMHPKNLWPSLNLRENPSAKQTASVWDAMWKRRKVFPQIQGRPQIEKEKIGSEETKHLQHMHLKNLWLSLNLRENPSAKQTASVWDAMWKRRKVFPQIQGRPQIEEEKIGSEETKRLQHMHLKNLCLSLNLREIFCQERLWRFWKLEKEALGPMKGLSK